MVPVGTATVAGIVFIAAAPLPTVIVTWSATARAADSVILPVREAPANTVFAEKVRAGTFGLTVNVPD